MKSVLASAVRTGSFLLAATCFQNRVQAAGIERMWAVLWINHDNEQSQGIPHAPKFVE